MRMSFIFRPSSVMSPSSVTSGPPELLQSAELMVALTRVLNSNMAVTCWSARALVKPRNVIPTKLASRWLRSADLFIISLVFELFLIVLAKLPATTNEYANGIVRLVLWKCLRVSQRGTGLSPTEIRCVPCRQFAPHSQQRNDPRTHCTKPQGNYGTRGCPFPHRRVRFGVQLAGVWGAMRLTEAAMAANRHKRRKRVPVCTTMLKLRARPATIGVR